MKMKVFMFKPTEWNVGDEIDIPDWVDYNGDHRPYVPFHAEVSAGTLWVYAMKKNKL